MTPREATTPRSAGHTSWLCRLLKKLSSLSFGGKVVAFIVMGNAIAWAIALAAMTLRAIGILPPALPFVPVEQPTYDRRECWRRHVEQRYGDAVVMDELNDDIQLQIRLQCDPNAAAFDGQ